MRMITLAVVLASFVGCADAGPQSDYDAGYADGIEDARTAVRVHDVDGDVGLRMKDHWGNCTSADIMMGCVQSANYLDQPYCDCVMGEIEYDDIRPTY